MDQELRDAICLYKEQIEHLSELIANSTEDQSEALQVKWFIHISYHESLPKSSDVISPAAFQECLFLITATGAATRGIG
jgi:hypothetical protein